MPPQREAEGYVEPNPELYGRLASLAKMTYDGLQSRDLLGEFDGDKARGPLRCCCSG